MTGGAVNRRLDRDAIVEACLALLASTPTRPLTLRRLGTSLGVDPTAVYRHFRDKDELLRAVADRLLEDVLTDLPADAEWDQVVREICGRIRSAYLAQPEVATLVRGGPPRDRHEFAITEALLAQLARAGLSPEAAAGAYHALIELTVGSSALDAELASLAPSARAEVYRGWRHAYAVLDPEQFPHAVASATHFYVGSADERFEQALTFLLAGLLADPLAGVTQPCR